MEVMIPPRDHRPTTYRYTWDENGEVERVQRVSDSADHRSSRQTLQWPFQNNNSPDAQTALSSRPSPDRTARWQAHQARLHTARSSPSIIERGLVPDYVINYLRGETPETIAQRASARPRASARGVVGVRRGDGDAHRSRVADFYFFDATGTDEDLVAAGADAEVGGGGGGGEKGGGGASRLVGWRSGVAANGLVAFLILVVGVVCLTFAVSRSGLLGGDVPIYEGSCGAARRIHWGLQVPVSVSAVALLATSNYVFQVLSSPTRFEVALAHERRRWLDIGIPSVRNLGSISGARVFMIVSVLLAALGIQVLYNGVLFVSKISAPSNYIFVTEPFLSGAPFSNASDHNAAMLSRAELMALQGSANRGELVTLTNPQCLSSLASAADYSAVLVVTDVEGDGRNSLIRTSPADDFLAGYLGRPEPSGGLVPDQSSVSFCLAQEAPPPSPSAPPSCELNLSVPLLGAAAFLNLVVVAVAAAASTVLHSFRPLATLGDALASFLAAPDPTTANACLLTKADVAAGRWPPAGTKHWVPRAHYWLATPSAARWGLFLLSWCVPAGLAATGLALSIRAGPGAAAAGLAPFGEPSAPVLVFGPGTSRAAASLLAALPHLSLAVLYLTLNALLSTYFLGHEFFELAVRDAPRTLRLSGRARGLQRTSLYLTLPRPFSWLLILLFSAAGFTLSASLVVVAVDPAGADKYARPTALSLSPVPLLAFLSLLIVLLALPLALGLRRADPTASYVDGSPAGNPLALAMRGGTCSAVISSKCHPPPAAPPPDRTRGRPPGGEIMEVDTTREAISWGVMREGVDMQLGRTGFVGEGREVGMIGVGRAYA